MYQIILMFIKMSSIDKVMFIVWSIGLVGMITSVVRFFMLCIITKLFQTQKF